MIGEILYDIILYKKINMIELYYLGVEFLIN